ncbi:hypothetical protein Malapachy_1903 [Malassezia pachydermatis]|uniref:Peroxin-14 n=1 Tax=Malassezia pachydermatis TaxID=77020 RepID=A0A0M8MNL0_9BASI|nr:hypothetical protein Malapachy_1903 [Malassezia pachydermatis]KOS13717.1 hypothetical protein Malapachy_1903 [Malassezia pachydermatis]
MGVEGDAGSSHAQAVRFLTSLRSQDGAASSGPLVLTEEQRSFLQSKGLDDEAIERARQDAERPENAVMARAYAEDRARIEASNDAEAFTKASQAFDEPLSVPSDVPTPPAASYPRSPLALYQTSKPPGPRDANEILSKLAATMTRPRYDVLVTFFRLLHMFLLLGGGASAVMVALYRRYLMPRLTAMVDARVNLMALQRDLFGKVLDSMRALQSVHLYKLLPVGYEPTWIEVDEPTEEKVEHPVDTTKEKQDETTASTETPKDEEPKTSEERPAADTTVADADADAAADELPPPRRRRVLAPIDVTQSLRSSLDRLSQSLQDARSLRTPTASVTDEDDEGLLDLTPVGPGTLVRDSTAGSAAYTPTQSMSSFRSSLDSVRNDLRAKLLSEEDVVSVIGNRFSAFAQSSTRATSGPAVEMLQIKAEIRSLKGLMLSRRNFPSYLRTSRVTPSFGTTVQQS